jgi:hypothetical protein
MKRRGVGSEVVHVTMEIVSWTDHVALDYAAVEAPGAAP